VYGLTLGREIIQGFSSLTSKSSKALFLISKLPFKTPNTTSGIESRRKKVRYMTDIWADFLGAFILCINI